jgi:hypothetical protein
LFNFNKKNKDVSVHVSLGAEVDFSGTVSMTRDMNDIIFKFWERYSDFDIIDKRDEDRFYMTLLFKEKAELNVCFISEIKEPRIIVDSKYIKYQKEDDSLDYYLNLKPEEGYHEKVLKDISKLKFASDFLRTRRPNSSVKSFHHLKANKRKLKSYNSQVRLSSARRFSSTRNRIQSAQQKKKNLWSVKRNKLAVSVYKKELRALPIRFKKKIIKDRWCQKNWILLLYFGFGINRIVEVCNDRLKHIYLMEQRAELFDSPQDFITHPEYLRMYSLVDRLALANVTLKK